MPRGRAGAPDLLTLLAAWGPWSTRPAWLETTTTPKAARTKVPGTARYQIPAASGGCLHNRCQGHGWHSARERLEAMAG